jgi:transcriptional regulator with XRE-family HTH domain
VVSRVLPGVRPGAGMSGFGPLLTIYRVRAGFSLKGLARAIDVDPSYIGRIEQGTRVMPRPECMQRLVAALGLTETERQTFALVGVGLLDAQDIVARMQHDATMHAANELIAACPCRPCQERRQAQEKAG